MIDISCDCEVCYVSFDYPITDRDVDDLIGTPFVDILKIRSIIKWRDDDEDCVSNGVEVEEEYYSVLEFVEAKFTSEQQQRVMEYFWIEIDKIRNTFLRPILTKRAKS